MSRGRRRPSAGGPLPVVELVGLPGSGKTTIGRTLIERHGDRIAVIPDRRYLEANPPLWIPGALGAVLARPTRFGALLMSPLFSLATLWRFRRFLGRFGWLRLRSTIAAAARRVLRRESEEVRWPSFWHTFGWLNFQGARRVIARARARRGDRIAVVDEGFVFGAIRTRIFFPPKWKEVLWKEYCRGIPDGCACIVIEVPPERALERFQDRESRVPTADLASWKVSSGPNWIEDTWVEMSRWLSDETLCERVRLRSIDGDRSPEGVVGEVLDALTGWISQERTSVPEGSILTSTEN